MDPILVPILSPTSLHPWKRGLLWVTLQVSRENTGTYPVVTREQGEAKESGVPLGTSAAIRHPSGDV